MPEKYEDTAIGDGIEFCCPGCHDELEDQVTRSNGKRAFRPYWVSLADSSIISD